MPLWQKFPELPKSSAGWRMGKGEDYASEFFKWFRALTPEDQGVYMDKYPEPVSWAGYYDIILQWQ